MPHVDCYDSTFFDQQVEGALRSGRVVAPIVCDLIHPASVVDVGCGRGAWLKAFQECGVEDVLGLDGDYVAPDALLIPPACFQPADLTAPLRMDRGFDLALCLEVAEHLPPAAAPGLIRSLVGLAPLVLFSAALPLQGGTHHVNERWPDYWSGLFAAHRFRRLDAIRGRVWQDPRVEWWYRQNLLLFADERAAAARPELAGLDRLVNDLTLIQSRILREHLSLRQTLGRLPGRAWRSLTGGNSS